MLSADIATCRRGACRAAEGCGPRARSTWCSAHDDEKRKACTRVEALVQTSDLARLEEKIFLQFTTLGVKTFDVVRNALERESRLVRFDGRDIRVKVATLPDGTQRAKPEFDDLRRVAEETSRPLAEIRSEVMSALNETEFGASPARGK